MGLIIFAVTCFFLICLFYVWVGLGILINALKELFNGDLFEFCIEGFFGSWIFGLGLLGTLGLGRMLFELIF
jgi:hypothetical protein